MPSLKLTVFEDSNQEPTEVSTGNGSSDSDGSATEEDDRPLAPPKKKRKKSSPPPKKKRKKSSPPPKKKRKKSSPPPKKKKEKKVIVPAEEEEDQPPAPPSPRKGKKGKKRKKVPKTDMALTESDEEDDDEDDKEKVTRMAALKFEKARAVIMGDQSLTPQEKYDKLKQYCEWIVDYLGDRMKPFTGFIKTWEVELKTNQKTVSKAGLKACSLRKKGKRSASKLDIPAVKRYLDELKAHRNFLKEALTKLFVSMKAMLNDRQTANASFELTKTVADRVIICGDRKGAYVVKLHLLDAWLQKLTSAQDWLKEFPTFEDWSQAEVTSSE